MKGQKMTLVESKFENGRLVKVALCSFRAKTRKEGFALQEELRAYFFQLGHRGSMHTVGAKNDL